MPKAERSLRELFYEIRRVTKSREILTEKRIRRLYKGVMQDLNGFLADAYVKYSDDEGRLTLAGLERKASYARFLEEVATRADALSPGLQREMLSLADDVYTRCWRSMTDAVQNAADLKPYRDILGDNLVRPETMLQAVKNNISKLTLPPLLERNRQDVIYQIRQVLGIGLMNGDRYDTMAKRITERLDVSYSKAVLTARTESHRNQEAGMLDCAKEISRGVEGSGLIYTATWRTMLDERVRPNHRYHTKAGWKTVRRGKADHQKMEGKVIRVGDRFDLGDGVYAEAPGSSGVAAHDCNCRCYLEYALMTPEEFVAAGGKLDEKEFTNAEERGIINTQQMAASGEDSIRWLPKGQELTAEERNSLVSYAADRGVRLTGLRGTDVDVSLITDVIDDAAKILRTYPELGLDPSRPFTIQIVNGMKADDFAEILQRKAPRTIRLNANAFRNREKLAEEYAKLVRDRWFPAGTDYRSIIWHEAGHMYASIHHVNVPNILSELVGVDARTQEGVITVKRYLKDHLSEYSSFPNNDFEDCISEVFNAYYSGTGNSFANRFMDILRRDHK